MESTNFDPASFLAATTTEVNEKRDAVPVGLYTATIGEISPEQIKSGVYDKGPNIGNPWRLLAIPLKLQIPAELQQSTGLKAEFTLTDRVFVDLQPNGMEDNTKGKNNRKRQYRDATRLNQAGEPFAWGMLVGRPIQVQITHEMYQGNIQERVGNILPL